MTLSSSERSTEHARSVLSRVYSFHLREVNNSQRACTEIDIFKFTQNSTHTNLALSSRLFFTLLRDGRLHFRLKPYSRRAPPRRIAAHPRARVSSLKDTRPPNDIVGLVGHHATCARPQGASIPAIPLAGVWRRLRRLFLGFAVTGRRQRLSRLGRLQLEADGRACRQPPRGGPFTPPPRGEESLDDRVQHRAASREERGVAAAGGSGGGQQDGKRLVAEFVV